MSLNVTISELTYCTLIIAPSHLQCKNGANSVSVYHLLIKLFSEQAPGGRQRLTAVGTSCMAWPFPLGDNYLPYTPGVYLYKTEICRYQLLEYFRVTEYEHFRPYYLSNDQYVSTYLHCVYHVSFNNVLLI